MQYCTRVNQPDATERELLTEFQQLQFPTDTFTFKENQFVGCGYDCTIGPHRVEGKNDKKSKVTGNLFVETQQTFDHKRTWQWSGLSLSLQPDAQHGCDFFVMAAYGPPDHSWFFWAKPQTWQEWCKQGTLRETMKGANGNRAGSYARGYTIRVEELKKELNHWL